MHNKTTIFIGRWIGISKVDLQGTHWREKKFSNPMSLWRRSLTWAPPHNEWLYQNIILDELKYEVTRADPRGPQETYKKKQ